MMRINGISDYRDHTEDMIRTAHHPNINKCVNTILEITDTTCSTVTNKQSTTVEGKGDTLS